MHPSLPLTLLCVYGTNICIGAFLPFGQWLLSLSRFHKYRTENNIYTTSVWAAVFWPSVWGRLNSFQLVKLSSSHFLPLVIPLLCRPFLTSAERLGCNKPDLIMTDLLRKPRRSQNARHALKKQKPRSLWPGGHGNLVLYRARFLMTHDSTLHKPLVLLNNKDLHPNRVVQTAF